ncbi:hypothetical protein PMIN04_008912 [Paraphaeosphaeria minitans]
MPRFPVSPYWSSNPNIPIFLDREDASEPARSTPSPSRNPRHVPEYCPTCQTSSSDTPIHCVTKSPAPSPAPPSYSSIVPQQQPPSPRHLTVPTLTVQTPSHWERPQAPTRALQFDPEGRPAVRFRRNAFSPLSPTATDIEDIDWGRKSHIGLGIPDAPFRPDNSPITPGTLENTVGGDNQQGASNLAQRIEQRLWNYTASRNVVKRWMIEIISWLLSAACMAGIIVMLLVYKGRPIPRWPLSLTLNAYISVLAKISSAALLLPVSESLGQLKWSWFQGDSSKKMWDFELFDSASRGPWGSFLLLVRTKGKSLAALGAGVTLLAMALDPFFQQLVEYPEVWRLQDGKGFLPRAWGYEPFAQGQEYQGGAQNMDTDKALLGVMSRFFYDNGTSPTPFGKGVRAEVPLACPNSNCTWPEYETLGVHSECVDMSDRLEFKCLNVTQDWLQVPIRDMEQIEDISYPDGESCGWWLKADKPLLMTGYDTGAPSDHAGETLIVRAQPLYDLFSREFVPGYEAKINNSRNPLAHIAIVSGHDYDTVHQNGTPIATECVLSFAAKTVQSTYSAGGYFENITNVIINDTVKSTRWITGVLNDTNSLKILFEYFYAENATINTQRGTYLVDNSTFVLTAAVFDDIFPSTYSLVNSTDQDNAMLRYKEYNIVNPYTRNVSHNPFQYANVSLHMDNMAKAFTNLIRSATLDTEMIPGDSWDQESIVDVRWAWLSLPLGLLVSTGLFLIATVVRSSNENETVGVWKTSAIATLLYGLPDEMSQKMKSEKTHGTPRAQAKTMRVKWIPKGGWRFSGASRASHVSSTADRPTGDSPTGDSPTTDRPTADTSQNPSHNNSHKLRQSPPAHWI